MFKKIITSGKSGVDTIALDTAEFFGIKTGGTANPITFDEDRSSKVEQEEEYVVFKEIFGLTDYEGEYNTEEEHTSKVSMDNVDNSDGTLILNFSNNEKTENLEKTIGYCKNKKWESYNTFERSGKLKNVYKPAFVIDKFEKRFFQEFSDFIDTNRIKTLNVCGSANIPRTKYIKLKDFFSNIVDVYIITHRRQYHTEDQW